MALESVGIVRDPLFKEHSNGFGHPESPERLDSIEKALKSFSLAEYLQEIDARDASFDELAMIHTKPYIRSIEATKGLPFTALDHETSAVAQSHAAAIRAVGSSIGAVDTVFDGSVSRACAFVRPPGHHAESSKAMGFCIFNNVAVAASHALGRSGVERVLILDWDVHHGNGTMHSFYKASEVLYISIHEFPHYPGTGRAGDVGHGAGEGFSVNAPMPPGLGDWAYSRVFEEIFLPISMEYDPDVILISAGFDAHQRDPLASMRLSSGMYGTMSDYLLEAADACCRGRLVAILEGGYDLDALSEGVTCMLESMIRHEGRKAIEETMQETGARAESLVEEATVERVIDDVRRALRPYWKSLS